MCNCVKNGLANHRFVQHWNLVGKEALLVVPYIIPKAEGLPRFVKIADKASTKFHALLKGDGGIAGSIFEDHLSLSQMLAESFRTPHQDEYRIGHVAISD